MEKVREKIGLAFPSLKVEILVKNSLGDALQDIPLHTVEGSDFFTRDIFNTLATGEADIAIHSLKDMSSEHFFGPNHFAVVDRDDTRDVAIFRNDIEEKLQEGKTIIIGTCSPRREEMATVFLRKALPQLASFDIKTLHIRGNVDTRLRKLEMGEYDGIILATAGLNRLLASEADRPVIQQLLVGKKLMLLPLVECVPAPCQGAIVAEAHHANQHAIDILKAINLNKSYHDCVAEKIIALKYGVGCIQKFGVTSINARNGKFIYSAGTDSENNQFSRWYPLPDIGVEENKLFSSTDHMKDFFKYEWRHELSEIEQPVVFIANYKSINDGKAKKFLRKKLLIASGTKTWYELAKQGYWITGSADGLGFEFILPSLKMPILEIRPADISIITHEDAAERWRQKGYNAFSNYKLTATNNRELIEGIQEADAIFWSSFSQFSFYGHYAKQNVTHICAGGETASLLKQQGIEPIIFPTIKAFEQWRTSSTRHHNAV
jgi:hydroxymethylbilane synthase